VWCDVDPCYVFHPMNAYDEDGAVVVDLVRHPKMFATHLTGPDEGAPVLERWRIDPAGGKVVTQLLTTDPKSSARRRANGGAPKPLRLQRRTHDDEKDEAGFTMDGALIKHDSSPGPARCGRSKAVPARRSSSRRARRRVRTRDSSSASCTTASAKQAISWCSTPRTSQGIRWRPSTFLFACPTASTATGRATRRSAERARKQQGRLASESPLTSPPSEQPQPLPREKSWSMTGAMDLANASCPFGVGWKGACESKLDGS